MPLTPLNVLRAALMLLLSRLCRDYLRDALGVGLLVHHTHY